MNLPVSIVIPNWNGRELLERNFPSVYEASRCHSEENEIIIVDNGSFDGSVEFIEKNFKDVKVIKLNKNKGFGFACNCGVEESRNEIFILLNNDVKVDKYFISPLLKHFERKDTFSVSAIDLNEYKNKKIPDKPVYILYSPGGYSAYDKNKFLSLGGFHHLYFPFYGEDRDIGYRAWKMGWKNILEPQSIVYHEGESTSKRLDKRYVEKIKFRNRIIFCLSCFDDKMLIFSSVIRRTIHAFFSFKWYVFPVFFWIFREREEIIKKRENDRIFWKYKDKEIKRLLRRV